MSETKKLKIESPAWNIKKRYKVNNVVSHVGAEWQNITGINSEPSQTSPDWIMTTVLVRPMIIVFGNPFFLIKHPVNNTAANKAVLENNDFICDGFCDGTRFWKYAQCLDNTPATLDNEISWNLIDEIEEIETI